MWHESWNYQFWAFPAECQPSTKIARPESINFQHPTLIFIQYPILHPIVESQEANKKENPRAQPILPPRLRPGDPPPRSADPYGSWPPVIKGARRAAAVPLARGAAAWG